MSTTTLDQHRQQCTARLRVRLSRKRARTSRIVCASIRGPFSPPPPPPLLRAPPPRVTADFLARSVRFSRRRSPFSARSTWVEQQWKRRFLLLCRCNDVTKGLVVWRRFRESDRPSSIWRYGEDYFFVHWYIILHFPCVGVFGL